MVPARTLELVILVMEAVAVAAELTLQVDGAGQGILVQEPLVILVVAVEAAAAAVAPI
jgi:hypothetical protein